MNLRVALDVIAQRLHDVKLAPGADIDYHSTLNRAPAVGADHLHAGAAREHLTSAAVRRPG